MLTISIPARIAALSLACVTAASAQTAVHVRVDNDAFNFWQAPWDRPDEEYTSGVRLSADYAGPAFWSKSDQRDARGCNPRRTRCVEHTWALEQDIYTAARHIGDPTPPPGSRPDAGLLWLQESQRIARPDRLDETSIAFGMTGPPALASAMQRIVHGYAPGWQRPIDWTRQLPFEPVVAVAYDQYRRVPMRLVELQPHAGLSFGNLLTEARAGVGARTGWNLAHPWLPGLGLPGLPQLPAGSPSGMGLALLADATIRAVARNETLSGDLFRASSHVTLRPLVAEFQLGVSARISRATISYIAHQTGAEYTTRTMAHQWSSLQAEWWFGKR